MVERKINTNLPSEIPSGSIFDDPPEGAPSEVLAFLRLAEREGAYSTLSETTRQRIEMYYLDGLSVSAIASIQNVSKQAVSQTIISIPEGLYRKMTKDVVFGRTFVSYREILAAYSDYRVYVDRKKNG